MNFPASVHTENNNVRVKEVMILSSIVLLNARKAPILFLETTYAQVVLKDITQAHLEPQAVMNVQLESTPMSPEQPNA